MYPFEHQANGHLLKTDCCVEFSERFRNDRVIFIIMVVTPTFWKEKLLIMLSQLYLTSNPLIMIISRFWQRNVLRASKLRHKSTNVWVEKMSVYFVLLNHLPLQCSLSSTIFFLTITVYSFQPNLWNLDFASNWQVDLVVWSIVLTVLLARSYRDFDRTRWPIAFRLRTNFYRVLLIKNKILISLYPVIQ